MQSPFIIIAAMDEQNGIGKNNDLPWHLSADLKHFAQTTKGGTVIMGRKTWESIPEKYRPFSERLNIVLTRNEDYELPQGVLKATSLDAALELAYENKDKQTDPEGETFIIGGATLFEEAIQHPNCQTLILTKIVHTFDCDAFFPEVPGHFAQVEAQPFREEEGIEYAFIVMERVS